MSFYANDPAKLDDPYPDFARYRAECPVVFDETLGQWFVFRHHDVSALFRDPRLSADRLAGMRSAVPAEALSDLDRIAPYFDAWVLMNDGERHVRLRSLLHEGFNPAVIQSLREKIATSAAALLAPAEKSGRLDVAEDFAFLLTAWVLADFLGVPEPRRTDVVRWSMDFIDFFNIAPITVANTRKMVTSGLELIACTKELLAERRRHPAPDFLGTLLQAGEARGGFSDDEIVGNAMLLLLAGHIAVRNLIGNAVWLLLTHPHQLAALRADRSLLRGTIEETLRFESPVAAIPRVALEDIEVAGKTIPHGSLVQLVLSSANRDESVHRDPDCFDIRRPSQPGLMSFGTGPHTCLGAMLAREESAIALSLLLDKFPSIAPDPDHPPVWYRNLGNRGPEKLPLLVH